MIYDRNTSPYKIEQLEKCVNLEKTSKSPSNMKANVNKLMSLIPRGKPSQSIKKEPISSSIFVNDPACKPSVPKVVTTQNFITLNPHPNREVTYKSKSSVVEPGDTFICEIINGNIRKIYLTDKEW